MYIAKYSGTERVIRAVSNCKNGENNKPLNNRRNDKK